MGSRGHVNKYSWQSCSNTEARELLWALHLHSKAESVGKYKSEENLRVQVAISKALIRGKSKSEPERKKQKGKRDIQGF